MVEKSLKERIKERFPDINTSFEVIGDIAIIEVSDKEKVSDFGEFILDNFKNVNVVLNKVGDIKDLYRVGEYEFVVKRDKERTFEFVKKMFRKVEHKETIHKENGVFLKLDPTKVYFSSKLSSERKRIMEMVREGEKILSLFSGVGPFPVVIAKYKNVDILANEINPDAVYYLKQNVEMNNLKGKIEIDEGDARELIKNLVEKNEFNNFDRVLMPAPKDAPDFIDSVLKNVKKGCVIHLYSFMDVEGIENKVLEKEIKSKANKFERKVEIESRICGNIGVRQHRVVLDIKVLE